MTWRNGRQLASYSLGGKTYRYEYDVNGLRTRKSNADGGYTEYYIIDGLAVAERRYYSGGGVQYTLRYLYDESNNPVGFGMQYPNSTRWTNYYFEKNVQGDVIGVYQKEGDGNSATHILAARYSYDPYGNPTSMTNGAGTAVSQTSNTIAAINPFRYRGYRYDGDTGLYYLRSRYYDPVSCRFVNADKYVSTGQGQLGHNMFAYCNNNPVRYDDPTGTKLDGLYTYVNDGGSSGSTNGSSENEQARMDSCSISSHDLNRRPNTGEPGSTYYSPNGDTRTYGPDGMPQHDYDHDDHGAPDQHPHDENGGHNHDWKNGVRGPAYSIGWQPIAGVVLVIGCAIGTAIVALDDATGVGVADDFLFGPLGAGIGKGISWIFR